jgi:hypothetical protein
MTTDTYPLTSLPALEAEAITKSDTVGFSTTARGIYVGVSGDIALVTPSGAVLTFKNASAGTIVPVRCIRVNAATTATNLIALF